MTGAASVLLLCLLGPGGARAAEPAGFRWRGVLEGFYGRPWTWEQRRDFVGWMGRQGFNLFVVGPKDEPSVRREWRRPFRREELEGLRGLIEAARGAGVEVAWTLSPLDADFGDPEEARAAADKLESALALGARKLVLGFDDMPPDRDHVLFANRVLRRVREAYPEADATFIPAEYWGEAAPSAYLDLVRRRLDPAFRVGWTGPQIISRTITAEDAGRFAEYMGRSLALGDNYPVQDRLAGAGRLFLGPLLGRDSELPRRHEAFVANASPLPEASKVALYTVARYAADPSAYDPWRAWEEAFAAVGGPRGASPLARLARHCASSWLTVPAPEALRRGSLEELARAHWERRDEGGFRRELESLTRLPEDLRTGLKDRPRLFAELEPWARKLALQGRAALAAIDRTEGRATAAEFDRLRRETWENQAVVADLALDRFLGRAAVRNGPPPRPLEPLISAYCRGEAEAEELEAALKRLIAAPDAARSAFKQEAESLLELAPWLEASAAAAGRASSAAKGRGSGPLQAAEEWAARWRLRLTFLPLLAAKALLDDYLARAEAAWLPDAPPPKGVSWPLRLWLMGHAWSHPDCELGRLAAALSVARAGGATAGLEESFRRLEALPGRLRQGLGPRLPEEIGPWLDKVGEYGATGRMSLRLAEKVRRGAAASGKELEEWRLRRYRLRSGNGLELALELRLLLDAFRRWALLPPGRRPPLPDLSLPADPAELL